MKKKKKIASLKRVGYNRTRKVRMVGGGGNGGEMAPGVESLATEDRDGRSSKT